MNKIETLIKELCPNGVEWKVISDVFNIRNGYTPRKNIPEFWDVKKRQFRGLEWRILERTGRFYLTVFKK